MYLILCLDDEGRFVPATQKLFVSTGQAKRYMDSIAPNRYPMAHYIPMDALKAQRDIKRQSEENN